MVQTNRFIFYALGTYFFLIFYVIRNLKSVTNHSNTLCLVRIGD
jgi:hypothetical protein